MWSFDVFFDLRLNKGMSKQLRCQWFEMPSRSSWCCCNAVLTVRLHDHNKIMQFSVTKCLAYLSNMGTITSYNLIHLTLYLNRVNGTNVVNDKLKNILGWKQNYCYKPLNIFLFSLNHSHIGAEGRWLPFSRHFQKYFLEWKRMNFDKDFTEVCSKASNQ